jgi:hypothetical protein
MKFYHYVFELQMWHNSFYLGCFFCLQHLISVSFSFFELETATHKNPKLEKLSSASDLCTLKKT